MKLTIMSINKMKIIGTLTILFLIISIGCRSEREKPGNDAPQIPPGNDALQIPPETLAKQWEDFVKLHNTIGFDDLDVSESQQWLTKYRGTTNIPDKIGFAKAFFVTELPQGIFIITSDHNGKNRVLSYKLPPPQENRYGNISETIKSLKEQGYEAEKIDGGYRFKKEFTLEHSW